MFISDPELDFLPIPDPGVKRAPNPGSATLAIEVFFIKNDDQRRLQGVHSNKVGRSVFDPDHFHMCVARS
jgi:hypothetical protein